MYLLPYQIKKLKTFGEVVFYENHSNSAKEWINILKDNIAKLNLSEISLIGYPSVSATVFPPYP
jgi:hypothetical protein